METKMGGYGSGRRSDQARKGIADHLFSIDVRAWKREGLLYPGLRRYWQWQVNSNTHISLNVQIDSDVICTAYCCNSGGEASTWNHQTVFLTATPCHYGGERVWFLCPSRGCGKRVAILYLTNVLACRDCLNLAYLSQRQPPDTRALNRVDKTRGKLGWKPGFLNGVEWKPQGMHWKTFGRLIRRYEEEVGVAKLRLLASMGIDYSPWNLFERK